MKAGLGAAGLEQDARSSLSKPGLLTAGPVRPATTPGKHSSPPEHLLEASATQPQDCQGRGGGQSSRPKASTVRWSPTRRLMGSDGATDRSIRLLAALLYHPHPSSSSLSCSGACLWQTASAPPSALMHPFSRPESRGPAPSLQGLPTHHPLHSGSWAPSLLSCLTTGHQRSSQPGSKLLPAASLSELAHALSVEYVSK